MAATFYPRRLTMSANTIPFILQLFFIAFVDSRSHTCRPSSCGNVSDIHYPFRLKTDPISCGYNNAEFELECHKNQTVMDMNIRRYVGPYNNVYSETVMHPSPKWYHVEEINYRGGFITVLEPSRSNVFACPLDSNYAPYGWLTGNLMVDGDHSVLVFIHCLSRMMNSSKYAEAPFCGNKNNIFANSSEFHSYVMFSRTTSYQLQPFKVLFDDDNLLLNLEESCTIDGVNWDNVTWKSTSLESNHDGLAYGVRLYYWRIFLDQCYRRPYLSMRYKFHRLNKIVDGIEEYFYVECCYNNAMSSAPWKWSILIWVGWLLLAILINLRLLIGFPFFIWLVVNKWRRRHLCMDKCIEEFLQSEQNLAPIQYSYSEMKKMTNNFTQQLGEGGFGVVYKGKLRSGPPVAIKVMEQSMGSEEEFISEVATIGQIHHCNIVQLIGFCVERSKCALVYEFLPNGSLDRYIFNQESVGTLALAYEKMFEIALGVARGIDYLHHGYNMQILHFDIKPHNILLDEKFNPKISDFGLARLHPTDESFMNLTGARGTIGYMAPEMFYNNFRGITYKADIYSFGMMLMEIAGKRKNMLPLVDDDSQMYFPSWAYEQLRAGKSIETSSATEVERKLAKKIVIVALWCIQMRPSARPPMSKVVQMLEGESEPPIPPKPFVSPHELATYDHVTNKTWRTIDYVTWDVPLN